MFTGCPANCASAGLRPRAHGQTAGTCRTPPPGSACFASSFMYSNALGEGRAMTSHPDQERRPALMSRAEGSGSCRVGQHSMSLPVSSPLPGLWLVQARRRPPAGLSSRFLTPFAPLPAHIPVRAASPGHSRVPGCSVGGGRPAHRTITPPRFVAGPARRGRPAARVRRLLTPFAPLPAHIPVRAASPNPSRVPGCSVGGGRPAHRRARTPRGFQAARCHHPFGEPEPLAGSGLRGAITPPRFVAGPARQCLSVRSVHSLQAKCGLVLYGSCPECHPGGYNVITQGVQTSGPKRYRSGR